MNNSVKEFLCDYKCNWNQLHSLETDLRAVKGLTVAVEMLISDLCLFGSDSHHIDQPANLARVQR
jgi:hypothetical protein